MSAHSSGIIQKKEILPRPRRSDRSSALSGSSSHARVSSAVSATTATSTTSSRPSCAASVDQDSDGEEEEEESTPATEDDGADDDSVVVAQPSLLVPKKAAPPRNAFEIIIKTKQDILLQTRQRCQELQQENEVMVERLKTMERDGLGNVQQIMQAQQSNHGSLSAMQQEYEQQKHVLQTGMDTRRRVWEEELGGLREQLVAAEERAQKTAEDIHNTLLYKEQGQFMNAQLLTKAQEHVRQCHRNNLIQQAIMEDQLEKTRERRQTELESQLKQFKIDHAHSTIDMLDDAVKQMALENMRLRREVEQQHGEQRKLEGSIAAILETIRDLEAKIAEYDRRFVPSKTSLRTINLPSRTPGLLAPLPK